MALTLERDVGDHLAQSLHFTNDEAVEGMESWQGQRPSLLVAALALRGRRVKVGRQSWV